MKFHGGTANLRQHLLRIHPMVKLVTETPQLAKENIEDNRNFENTVNQVIANIASCSSAPHFEHLPRPSGVTSNKTKSFSEVHKVVKKRPIKQLILFGSRSESELSESKILAIESKLIKMITTDYQPLSLVENVGFLEYSNELQPLYKPPSRKRLTNYPNTIQMRLQY